MKRFLLSTGFLTVLLAGSLVFFGSPVFGSQIASAQVPASLVAAFTSDAPPVAATSPYAHDEVEGRPSRARTEVQDDEAVYRQSPSVRAIARWLHLDTETASHLFELSNFAILAGAILYFAVKYLPKTLRMRRESIQKDLLDARTATEQANARLKAVEQRFARLDEEIAGIRKQAEQDGFAEESRIKALIESERQRIVVSAEQEIGAAAAAARRGLKQLAAELAIDRAEKMISLSEDGDRTLVRQFSRDVTQGAGRGERN